MAEIGNVVVIGLNNLSILYVNGSWTVIVEILTSRKP